MTTANQQQQELAEKLSAADARLLRSFLLQQRWFSGRDGDEGMPQLLMVAKRLPLYELANTSSYTLPGQAMHGQQQQPDPGLRQQSGCTV